MGTDMQNAPVNDLIFRELIKRGYSLDGNTRVWNIADSKLWYLTPEQAQAYLDLENSEEYGETVSKEEGQQLIEGRSKDIIEWAAGEPVNVVDLGCGNGKKAASFIRSFEGKIKVRYCPIDISGYMVKKARETFKEEEDIAEEIAEFQYNISDFENLDNVVHLLKGGGYKKNLILLLGNTLGNFEINELLYEIRSSMSEKDLLMIDTDVARSDMQEVTEAHLKNPAVDRFFILMPLQLGLEKEDLEYGIRYKNYRLEVYYTIKNNKVIEFNNKTVTFQKGDQIIVAVNYKYEEKDLLSYFNLYFSQVSAHFLQDRSKAVALCRK